MTFKDFLRDAALSCDSQQEYARHLGISPQYLSDLLSGRRSPHPRICDKMGEDYAEPVRRRLHKLGARAVGWRV